MKTRIHFIKDSMYALCMLFFFIGCNNNNKNKAEATVVHSVDTVTISQMQFSPAVLHVSIGDTVYWINKDIVAHTVVSRRDQLFNSDTLDVGKSWKWVVTDSAAYYCSIHPTMNGEILLK